MNDQSSLAVGRSTQTVPLPWPDGQTCPEMTRFRFFAPRGRCSRSRSRRPAAVPFAAESGRLLRSGNTTDISVREWCSTRLPRLAPCLGAGNGRWSGLFSGCSESLDYGAPCVACAAYPICGKSRRPCRCLANGPFNGCRWPHRKHGTASPPNGRASTLRRCCSGSGLGVLPVLSDMAHPFWSGPRSPHHDAAIARSLPLGRCPACGAPAHPQGSVPSALAAPASPRTCYLVDPASSHMLVSKIKPCMCKYELIQTVKLRMAH